MCCTTTLLGFVSELLAQFGLFVGVFERIVCPIFGQVSSVELWVVLYGKMKCKKRKSGEWLRSIINQNLLYIRERGMVL